MTPEQRITDLEARVKKLEALFAQKPAVADAQLKARKDIFYNQLTPYVKKYGVEMMRSFFDYWTETNKSGTKMRFELEKTWEHGKRLATWERNGRGKNMQPGTKPDYYQAPEVEDPVQKGEISKVLKNIGKEMG